MQTQLPAAFYTQCMQNQPVQECTTYFVYTSPPAPVWGRPRFRNNIPRPRGIHDYYNVMWDPRVRRGDPLRRETDRRDMARCLKPKRAKKRAEASQKPETPPPLDGRKHFDTQTDNYLEDLDADIVEFDVKTQTEALHELPVAPWFTPAKLGIDKDTQIHPGDCDLFNFDIQVQPIVETLVGKVVEQALLEVMEEHELQSLIAQQHAFDEKRRLEQLRLHRLQQREILVANEKERLMAEMKEQLDRENETEERIGANAFAALYLSKATSGAIRALRDDGFLSAKGVISSVFVPWLNCEVEHVLSAENLARTLLDDIILNTVTKREAEYAAGMWAPAPAQPTEQLGEYQEE